MEKQTLGSMIAALRREKGMTQQELADRMGVTDKAVSKWERDLACPDIHSLPKLAELFGLTVDELMQTKPAQSGTKKKDAGGVTALICRAVALAMGVSVFVLSLIDRIDLRDGLSLLGIGVACLAVPQFIRSKE